MHLAETLFGMTSATVLALAVLSGPAVQDTDPTTGLPARVFAHARAAPRMPPGNPGAAAGPTVEVLWDVTHGVDFGYEPAFEFSDLVALLGPQGFNVSTTNAGVDNIDLSPFAIIVVCVGSAWYSPYTLSEAEVVKQFVLDGGGLLVLADNANTPNNLQPIARRFGTAVNRSRIQPSDLYFTDFTDHSIFTGIDQIYFRAAGALRAVPPSEVAARTDMGEPVVAVVSGSRVVVLGDLNVFDNTYMANADNASFAVNVFHFLAGH